MGVAEDLEKLAALRQSGALDEREYAEAKEAVLRAGAVDTSAERTSDRASSLGDAANRFVTFQIAMTVVTTIVVLLLLVFVVLPRFQF